MSDLNRRGFIKSAMAASVAGTLGPFDAAAQSLSEARPPRPIAISSANGTRAIDRAMEMMRQGEDTLDAVVAGVNIVEDDPNDRSVGYGGLPNEDGVVELDSCVMHGPSNGAGAVASIRNIKNPSSVAKVVMERTDHVLLVGEGALRFARAHGFEEVNLLTDESRERWLRWKENLSDRDDWIPPSEGSGNALMYDSERVYGTINCNAVNERGEVSGVTTTSGLSFKIPGRVGDSPIFGAGLYVDGAVGACGSTGRGEANLTTCASFLAVDSMRRGMSPEQAGLEACKRIAEKTTSPRLLNDDGHPNFNVNFYVVNKRGEYAGASIWSGSRFAVHDGNESSIKQCAYLFERPPRG